MHGNEDEDAIDPEEDKAELVESCVSISNSINRNMIGTVLVICCSAVNWVV